MSTPKLKKIDLRKGEDHDHPDIDTVKSYLCKINKSWYAGKFNRQWYGLNFDSWINPVGLQYDKPGTNCSQWKEVYEIQETRGKDARKSK